MLKLSITKMARASEEDKILGQDGLSIFVKGREDTYPLLCYRVESSSVLYSTLFAWEPSWRKALTLGNINKGFFP